MASLLQNLWGKFIEKVVASSSKIIAIVIILVIGYIIIKIITRLVARFFDKVDFERGVETFIENAIKVILYAILVIVILANLGVNVSGLLAGLGIIGIIIGFALQDTLGNLASGVFILFNKPFRVGDTVNIAGIVAVVEKIGIAACELNSPDNIKITIPNKKIWGDIIQNYTGNKMRKIFNLEVGISYDSDMDKAIKIVNEILKNDGRVLKDPQPEVVVKSLADSSVVLAIRPAVKPADYWPVYFDAIKAIKQEFDKNGIAIPFPQRDVWIKDMPKSAKKGKK
ncbi:mechanosensitive ion channel family protein [Candidatus Woesearchaeota archaeon]|nr:mechanosensitive ion channel family protein [Candidatus Woesearchaeota archaeon]